ncbi:ATP-dependent RecD-like DNA helicase [Mangrovibacillus cuniculi]|uniref:ATP-dependent RecD2 DNA helicase n=1 Tax=Mangrovibacillus cuniculi TaxID=2593652 RepID=A0A7S8CBL3_9BACI|nr:ATP-dependent RecD-like DNA helicase [Mangrovibacillus cuniculi]QPC46997.1 ATP-dependent RecD-like DNA helicase [Mangrovibacillus cuniculi]
MGQDSMQQKEPYVKGRLLVTIFYNESNLYSVVRIRVEETNTSWAERELMVTGYFPSLEEETTYTFYGQLKEHPKFGPQFHVSRFQKEMPQSKQGTIQYLSSDLFEGIGKKTAERIVDHIGEGALRKILADPSILDDVPQLAKTKAESLINSLKEHQGLEHVMVGLTDLGFGPQLSMKIFSLYKEDSLSVIEKNPYILVEDIEGIGFKRADQIGIQLGFTGGHPDRMKAAILHLLDDLTYKEGHTYVEAEELLPAVVELLAHHQEEIPFEDISKQVLALGEEGKIIIEERKIFMPSLYFSEKGLVTSIERILADDSFLDEFPESEFLLALGELEEALGVEYAPSQKEAIEKALKSGMMILTGGPGTGKTTVIKGIVEIYSKLHGKPLDKKEYKEEEVYPYVLVAPTGRAAKRMQESTGLNAMTIHRLLGWKGQEEEQEEEDDEPVPFIKGSLLIIDESSMVDSWLAHQLFKRIPKGMQVIMVGDDDQLPSVGPGQVLKDLIESNVIPTVQLTDIYRQAEGSSIIELAHSMKEGTVPANLTEPQKDRSFIQCTTAQLPDVVEKVVANATKKGYALRDIQVLAPMYRGAAGIDELNKRLQEIVNPNLDGKRKELKFGEVVFRIGDKVLQLVNQPEQNVFNGDMGEVISIFYAKENTEKEDMVIVSYDGNEVTYTRQDLNQITHAFCCSIHKSQGSEFPIVIIPVVRGYYRMLRRNLLYTAITRSKRFLILCGETSAFRLGVERTDDLQRRTMLKSMLQLLGTGGDEEMEHVALTEDTWEKVNPMIGMENVTPNDFELNS